MVWDQRQTVKRPVRVPDHHAPSESACRAGTKRPMAVRPYGDSALPVQYFRRICFHFGR
jgi:hypothetical protein